MSRTPPTPAETVRREMESIERLIHRMLISNRNLDREKGGRHLVSHPKTTDFVKGPLKEIAEHILERLAMSKELFVDMAADPDTHASTLSEKRQAAAEAAISEIDFGKEVEGFAGWVEQGSYDEVAGGKMWLSRLVFLRDPENRPDATLVSMGFAVGSAEISEVRVGGEVLDLNKQEPEPSF